MPASPPEQKFALRSTLYAVFAKLLLVFAIITPTVYVVAEFVQRSTVFLIPPLVLVLVVLGIVYRRMRIRITPDSVHLDIPRNRVNIDFAAVRMLTLSYHGLLVARNKYQFVYISAAWADAGAAAEYVIHRLKDLDLLDAVELHGDTEKIAAVADRKEHLQFQTRLQSSFLGKYFTRSGADNTGQRHN